MTALDEFAPYPEREEDVTADALLRFQTIGVALPRQRRLEDLKGALCRGATEEEVDDYVEAVGAFGDAFGVVFVLRQLPADMADSVARALWTCWQDGADMTERLHGWLKDYGIDPDEVTEAARQSRDEAETAPKETTHV